MDSSPSTGFVPGHGNVYLSNELTAYHHQTHEPHPLYPSTPRTYIDKQNMDNSSLYSFSSTPDTLAARHSQPTARAEREETHSPFICRLAVDDRQGDAILGLGPNSRGVSVSRSLQEMAVSSPSPAPGERAGFSVPICSFDPSAPHTPAQPASITVRPASATFSSRSSTPGSSWPFLWEEYIDGVLNKHHLAVESITSLHGFAKVAQHPNEVAADVGTRIDLYSLVLRQQETLNKMEKSLHDLPTLKRKVDEMEEKIAKAKFVVDKAVKEQIKSSIELQKQYGLHAGMSVEAHRKDITDAIKKIGSSVRDNLRRDFIASLQPGTSKTLDNLTTACGRKYQHNTATGRIDLNFNLVQRLYIVKNSEQIRLKEAVSVDDDDVGGLDDEENEDAAGFSAKRSRLTGTRSKDSDTGGGTSTGRTAHSDSFWYHVAEFLKQEQEFYKSKSYTSAEWKERMTWVLAQEADNMYEGLRRGTVIDPRDAEEQDDDVNGEAIRARSAAQPGLNSQNLHTLLPIA
ncbi:hypothetical protein AAF712_014365 [Marasmius tenuissimus]|uniref:Uncharacterized protein n=1 Tax=Marasmius tenuissimus TaxID=585030 RepID=A0ABR2ZB84_9AGAR